MAIKDKKDVSVLIEAQIPEFVTQEHPKFKQFIERYYEFMESQQVYFTGFEFNEDKLVPETTTTDNGHFIYEDGVGLQLESDRDTLANANLQFLIGETLTGNTSTATAVVTGTMGNTLAFIKPTNEATFKIDEKITGSTSRAYAVLANGVSANVFPDGSIESFRSRGAIAATRELESMQDIDGTSEGLIDDAWKKEFYTNIPTTTKTDRRQLLKNMKEVYKSKGNESSFTWLFRSLYAKEDIEFYYPKNDMSKLSDGKWTLEKSIKIATVSAENINLFTGKRVTGSTSGCSGMVEHMIESFVEGGLQITELILSNIELGFNFTIGDDFGALSYFTIDEAITTEADANGDVATGTTLGTVTSVTIQVDTTNMLMEDGDYISYEDADLMDYEHILSDINVGGTGYVKGDTITMVGGGGGDASGIVSVVEYTVDTTAVLMEDGDNISYEDADLLVYEQESDVTIATGAIKQIEVNNFGGGYTSPPTVSTSGGNQDAQLTAVLGAYGEYAGKYVGTDGLLSGTPKIQDGKYYQDFSYVIKTDFDVNIFRNDVKRIIHPSGLVMFGELAIRNKVSARMFDDGQSGNVDSLTPTDTRKNHTLEVAINSYANLQYQSSNTQNELEIFTADHPWQAMDARLEVRDNNNLLEENFRDVTVARSNSTSFTVTDTLHGLVVDDTIQISGFPGDISTDYWDGKYVIQTIPTTNTYTVIPGRGDPGAGVTADPYFYIVLDSTNGSADAGDNIIMEDSANNDLLVADSSVEYLTVETISFANVWLSNTANWDTPFNGAILDEAGDNILIEPGGTFLYPNLQFPIAETGTVSIDMSFSSDLLMEDHGYDTGLSDSGYILTEDTGSMGTGPARYIALEEDTWGTNHYESIPFFETSVSWTNSQTTGWMILQEDGSGGFLYEDDSNPALGERILTEYSHVTTSDEGKVKRVVPTIEYIDYVSGLGRIITENGDLIINEVISSSPDEGVSYIREEEYYNSSFVPTVEFDIVDSMGWHLRGEDGSYIINEDKTRTILELPTNRSGSKTITSLGSTQPATVLSTGTSSNGGANMGGELISDYTGKGDTTGFTFGMQVFRPHYTSQWKSPATDISFTHDRMTLEGEVGLLLAEDDLLVTDHILFEDYPAIEGDILNSGEAYSEFIQLEDQGAGNNILNEDNLQKILMETSRIFPSEYRIHQSWIVIPAYQHSRVLTRLEGQISIPHNSTTVTGTNTTFTSQVKAGDIFQTADENIILEDTTTMLMENGDNITYEDDDLMDQEHVESDTDDLQLEDGGKVILTEPGEFKIASITNDTTLVVTRKHWGGTDAVFWRQ